MGSVFGSFGGQLPGAEVLAALALSAVAAVLVLVLRGLCSRQIGSDRGWRYFGPRPAPRPGPAAAPLVGRCAASVAVVSASAWLSQRPRRGASSGPLCWLWPAACSPSSSCSNRDSSSEKRRYGVSNRIRWMAEFVALTTVFGLVGLIYWLGTNSDDDNGGGGLMQPALVPVRVNRR